MHLLIIQLYQNVMGLVRYVLYLLHMGQSQSLPSLLVPVCCNDITQGSLVPH